MSKSRNQKCLPTEDEQKLIVANWVLNRPRRSIHHSLDGDIALVDFSLAGPIATIYTGTFAGAAQYITSNPDS